MKFLKKYYKLIGTLITVVAFVFVIKKIVTMDVDWSMFASGKPLGIIAGCVLVQTAIIFFMSTPWVQFVRILSGKKIAMKDALPVYTKCNLMKYVPGNVFQYVGRNQLAADLHISHVDVACATVLEILCSLVAPLVWILLLMGKDMVGLIRTYEKNFLLVLGIGVAVLVLAFFLLRWKFREPLRRYFEKYRKLLNRKILLRVVGVFLLYVLQYLFSATMYAVPAFLMFDVPQAQMGLFLGPVLVGHWLHHPRCSGRHRCPRSSHGAHMQHISGHQHHYALRRYHANHLHIRRCAGVLPGLAAASHLETAKDHRVTLPL